MHPSSSISESYLIFSDVHLGSDVNDCTPTAIRRSASIDRDLVLFLAHYRREKPSGARWHIVIAGDFIDFIGMTITAPMAELRTEPTDEEREHGLGNSADHARLKLRRVAERHADVFRELARFVAEGHALTLVHGNHDIELYWEGVRDDLREILLAHGILEHPDLDGTAFQARIDFSPWFFYCPDVAYIEHGHQYDAYCSTEHVMVPLSPLDPRRIARTFTDVLLRFVVRRTRGMTEHGHERAGLFDYVAFAMRLGVRGALLLGGRFAFAVRELFRLRRAHLAEAARALRAEQERRMALLAERTRIGLDRLRSLLSLQVAPITRSVAGILGSVLLDRVALALSALALFLGLRTAGFFHGHAIYGALGTLTAWALLHVYLARRRQIDPTDQLRARATKLAQLFPAAFVVMGHTHVPARAPAGNATYINVGSWAEEEEVSADAFEEHAPRAPRTHLVIHVRGDRPEAQLLTWEPGEGPRRYDG